MIKTHRTEVSEGINSHGRLQNDLLFLQKTFKTTQVKHRFYNNPHASKLFRTQSNMKIQLSSLAQGTDLSQELSKQIVEFPSARKLNNNSLLSQSIDDFGRPQLKMIKLKNKPSRCLDIIYKPPKQKSHTPISKATTLATLHTSVKQERTLKFIKNKRYKNEMYPKTKSFINKIHESPFRCMNYPKTQKQQTLDLNQITSFPQIQNQPMGIKLALEDQIDDFNQRLFGTRVMKQIINTQRRIPHRETRNEQEKYRLVRLALIEMLHYLQKLKLTPREYLNYKVFPTKPYERDNAKQYFQLCKMGKNDKLITILENNKYLVYEYDHLVMTTLHWCSIRGLFQTAVILLKYGADPDAQDIVGRTPLYLALENKQNEIAQLLLMNKANPWNKINLDYMDSVFDNEEGKHILSQCRKTHILLRMTPPSQRKYIWQKEQLTLYSETNL